MSEYSVKWYSGRVLYERPQSIIIDGEEVKVQRVSREEIMEDSITRNRIRVFLVKTERGDYKISYFPKKDEVRVKPVG